MSSRFLAPLVRELVFEPLQGPVPSFLPGQWVNLFLPLPGGEVKRAYSIASPPRAGESRFEVAVTRVEGGPGSSFLHAIPEGTVLRASGPHGVFTRDAGAGHPSLFVATGTGVTPLRSMMMAAIAADEAAPLWLLFGARFEQDILYREELQVLAREKPSIRYEVTLSRPDPSWAGRQGYVQLHLPALYRELCEAAPFAPHVYVCGLERMVSTAKEILRTELNVDRKHLHVERYD